MQDSQRLIGKTAVVTGASQGLGFEISRTFLRQGARVLICSRTRDDLMKAFEQLNTEAPGRILIQAADVSAEADVGRLRDSVAEAFSSLDILVCNAAIQGPKGRAEEVDWNEWRKTIETNIFGTALCCRTFMALLQKSRRGKIIILSGGGATKPFPFVSAYGTSKAAVVRYGETLAEELRERNVDVNMVAPGAMNTRLLDGVLDAGPERVGRDLYEASLRQKQSGGDSPSRAADLCAFLASSDSDGITGKLISAVWDPWQRLSEHRKELASSDIYTLRRIIPEDRGKKWD